MGKVYVGIDPGVNTGYAVWHESKFVTIATGGFWSVIGWVENLIKDVGASSLVFRIENPILWRDFTKNRMEWSQRAKGAGSVERDFKLWVEYFERNNLYYEKVNPKHVGRMWDDADIFKKMTNYNGRCSKHGRDAARLVWGR
jgi:hypothetical protein